MDKKIVLGSGKLYYQAISGDAGDIMIPSDTEIEQEAGLLGWIKGGATVRYRPEVYSTKDDVGMVSKKILVNE